MNTRMARAAAAAGGLAIAAAFAVSCSQAQEATKDIASSASSAAGAAGSAASSAASAAGSAASSVGSAAGSAASSVASGASSAASSAASGASSAVSSGASAASSAVSSAVEGATTMNVPGVGDVSLDADTAAAWTRLGGASGLGAPTGMSEKVGDGFMTPFASGTIYSSPAGAYLVQGEILRVYGEQGGPAGALGFPTGDESTTGGGPKTANGGWITEFQNGSISWTNDGMGGFTETVTKN
jgi:uncharacterized protein with LGFP repeats